MLKIGATFVFTKKVCLQPIPSCYDRLINPLMERRICRRMGVHVNLQSAKGIQPGQVMAAIDMGSNSFHMVLARLEGGEVRPVQKLAEKVMLAAGLDAKNQLSDEAMERGIACLRRFAQMADNVDPHWIRCIGTNTLRRARNAEKFLTHVREILNCPVEVVAGREEARLIYLGVSHSLPDTPGRRLVFDIGGGSTEFIVGERFDALMTESLHIGCVDYRERFFPKGGIGAKLFDKAVTSARREITSIDAACKKLGWESVVGSSGTVRAVEAAAQASGYCTSGVTLEAMYKLRERVVKAKSFAELDIPGLKEDRRSVFPSGLAIMIAICEQLSIERMGSSEGAMREGVLYDMLGRLAPEDVRERSIQSLIMRYSVDIEQAKRVQSVAIGMFDQVSRVWQLQDEEWRDLLGWAALTHEVGLAISHSGFHKHGAYVLTHSDMAGFTRQEQLILATLVVSHRRKLRETQFETMASEVRLGAIRVTLLLRLAVVLNHSRRELVMPPLVLEADAKKLTVRFPKGWLEERPLTEAGLQEEVEVWQKLGVGLVLC